MRLFCWDQIDNVAPKFLRMKKCIIKATVFCVAIYKAYFFSQFPHHLELSYLEFRSCLYFLVNIGFTTLGVIETYNHCCVVWL